VKVRFGGAVGDGTKACPSQHPRGMIFRGWGAAEFEETSSKTQEREETTIVRADDPTRWGPSAIFIAFDGDVQGIAPHSARRMQELDATLHRKRPSFRNARCVIRSIDAGKERAIFQPLSTQINWDSSAWLGR
jgi:hypothetical protein